MTTIPLQLDAETIARLEETGDSHTAGSLGNEILGMALLEAYQHHKRLARVAARMDSVTVRKVPATTKRPTYAGLLALAAERGVVVQSTGRTIQFWRKGAEHTTGECSTVGEAWAEIEAGLI